MRVVVVGGYGLIGSYIVSHLLGEGHEVVGVGRDVDAARRRFPDVNWETADLASATATRWGAVFDGADVVVNSAGALQDSPRDDLRAVHVDGVANLLAGCGIAGVRRFIHISAAGVTDGRPTAFNNTKLAAEALIRGAALDWVILRPGLVVAPAAYGGTALLRGLAAFPLCLPVVYPTSVVQVVSVEDVALAVSRCLNASSPAKVTIDLVHAETLSLAALLIEMRRWLGIIDRPVLVIPGGIATVVARISDGLAYMGWRSPMRTASVTQLRLGVTGDASVAQRVLGLELRSLRTMLNNRPAGVQERWFAKAYFLKPAILFTLVLFWLLSGIIGLGFRFSEATAVLTIAGVGTITAKAAVVSGSLIDIALAVGACFRRSAPGALQGILLVSTAYMLVGTIFRPDLWLDPLGPFLKTIPAAMLAASALALMDER